jgi:hypothetical protein
VLDRSTLNHDASRTDTGQGRQKPSTPEPTPSDILHSQSFEVHETHPAWSTNQSYHTYALQNKEVTESLGPSENGAPHSLPSPSNPHNHESELFKLPVCSTIPNDMVFTPRNWRLSDFAITRALHTDQELLQRALKPVDINAKLYLAHDCGQFPLMGLNGAAAVPANRCPVVLKVYHNVDLTTDAVRHELQLHNSLSHPNVVQSYGIFEEVCGSL